MPLMNAPANGKATPRHGDKVLVVSIDDGLFACHLDWVEALYHGQTPRLHAVRGDGGVRRFVLHGPDAAAIVDLRELLGLEALLGATRRSGHLLVHAGPLLLALSIDACVGVRELDLRRQTPIPTRVLRDGSVPFGHLLELDGRPLTVLDPGRLLDAPLRDALLPLQARAAAFLARQARIEELWEAMRGEASADQVRAFASLCRRSGRSRAAGAARRVLQHMEHNGSAPENDRVDAVDRLVCELVRRQRERSSGSLLIDGLDGSPGGAIVLAEGRVVNAVCGGIEGRGAFSRLLAIGAGPARFSENGTANGPARISEGTIALTIAALEALPGDRTAPAR